MKSVEEDKNNRCLYFQKIHYLTVIFKIELLLQVKLSAIPSLHVIWIAYLVTSWLSLGS